MVDRVVDRVVTPFVQPVVDAVDVDELLDQVDLDALLDRIDVDALLDRVDVNRLLDRVDPDRLLDRVDPDRLLDRVDPNRLLDRVDPNRLLERVDVDALVSRTELRSIIARSTAGVFGSVVDVGRSTVMAVDLMVHRVPDQLRHAATPRSRRPEATALPRSRSLLSLDRAVSLQDRPAGVVSRFAAFLVDAFVVTATFALLVTLTVTASDIIIGIRPDPADIPLLMTTAFFLWQLLYYVGLTAATGRTVGKAVLGLCVTEQDGSDVGGRGALLRTLTFPLGFFLFGAGFLLGLARDDRRMLHDLIGRTSVRYQWDAEVARLRVEATDDHLITAA